MRASLALVLVAALGGSVLAANPPHYTPPRRPPTPPVHKNPTPQHQPKTQPPKQDTTKHEYLTCEVFGAVDTSSVSALSAALSDAGLKVNGKITHHASGPSRVVVTAAHTVDLSAAAKKIGEAKITHPEKNTAGLALVLFAKLDSKSSEAATKALEKIKGVDASASKVDSHKGQIEVRIAGDHKITPSEIVSALRDAKVHAEFAAAKVAKAKA